MAIDHIGHLRHAGTVALFRPFKGVLQVAKEPGAALATATDHDAVHAGLLDHGNGVLGGENVAVAENRHVGDCLAQAGNGVPVGLTGVVLGGGAAVQGNRGNARVTSDFG